MVIHFGPECRARPLLSHSSDHAVRGAEPGLGDEMAAGIRVSRAVARLAFTHIGQINPGPSSQEFVVLQAFHPAQKGRSGITMTTGGGFPEVRETRASTHRETAKRVDATESCGACDRDPAGFDRAPRVRWRGGTMADARNSLTVRGKRVVRPASARLLRAARPRCRDRSGVDEPGRWRARPVIWTLTLFTILAALAFLLWLAWSFYVLIRGEPSAFRFDPDRRCAQLGFSCGALSNFATSGLLLAIASAFLLWRLYTLLRRYQARARTESRELVPTAGTILDPVVGRAELGTG